MPTSLAIEFDPKPMSAALLQLGSKDIHYALTRGLSRAAVAFRDVLRADLPEDLTIRTPYEARQIQSIGASLSDAVPFAQVGSVSSFMEKMVTGGEKVGKSGNTIGVPEVGEGLARPTIQDVTKRSDWPGAKLKKYYAYQNAQLKIGIANAGGGNLRLTKANLNAVAKHHAAIGGRYEYFIGRLGKGSSNASGSGVLGVWKITDPKARPQKLQLVYVMEKKVNLPVGKWSFAEKVMSKLPTIVEKCVVDSVQQKLEEEGWAAWRVAASQPMARVSGR